MQPFSSDSPEEARRTWLSSHQGRGCPHWVVMWLVCLLPTGVGAAVIDNHLYVVGGHSGSSYLNTVQKYDPISDTWLDSAGMMYCRCNFGLTAL